jgi:hypothetical protein
MIMDEGTVTKIGRSGCFMNERRLFGRMAAMLTARKAGRRQHEYVCWSSN